MEITYINSVGESITLRQLKPYFLRKIDGTGSIRQTINTFKAPDQDGAFYISSVLDMRNITIEGTLLSQNSSEAQEKRERLLKVFSPKLSGILVYRSRRISCVIEEAGFVVSSRERMPNFFISLLCPSPYFESLTQVREELASWMPLFSFVFELEDSGMEFGLRQPSQIITVDNIGDVSCGCEIVFQALGAVVNPELMNLDTGEYLRLNTTMEADTQLRISTHFANKRVTSVSGQSQSNAFSLLDTGSTFLQLSAGRNLLRYSASENMELLEVSIYYRPQYLGA
ncbi:phage tail family protein [Alkalibacter rhizosphaerae]|uniref:Phage tail family protein n=1 Tax=Alkalibacter rhizosphaerae TaxID=2815577 RepID=A0A975AIJ2_9FIRM|nr:phage tail family protein [Alkalibacter rhizosphaerae]QSX09532.1 phage tail family protein [Alkalibacter rhizosphaerae]